MTEETKQRNQVNVRLDDDTNAIVNKLAQQKRVSKSEVCRQALTGELAKIDAKQNKVFTPEERKEILVKLGSMTENISVIRNNNAKFGNNVNQIARAANQGVIKTHPQIQEFEKHGENMGAYLEKVAKELNEIWQLLA